MKIFSSAFYALAICALAFTGCEDPEALTGTVQLNAKAMWDDQDLMIGETYQDPFDRPILVEQFKMYISSITLLREDGAEFMMEDVDLINFNANWSASTTVPAGSYTGIKFGIGVPAEWNTGEDPAQYESSNPLSVQSSQGMFWTWNSGYIFLKFEGKTALDGDASNMTDSYAFHIGTDNYYRTVTLDKIFTIGEDDAVVDVAVNCAEFLEGNGDTIDLEQDFITHTGDNMPLAARFMDLFVAAFE